MATNSIVTFPLLEDRAPYLIARLDPDSRSLSAHVEKEASFRRGAAFLLRNGRVVISYRGYLAIDVDGLVTAEELEPELKAAAWG